MTASANVRDAFQDGLRALAHERVDLAVERLGIAAAGAPEDATVHAFLATALFAAARPDDSSAAIDRALELAPDAYWPNLKAGELRLRLGDAGAATEHFLAALRAVEPGTADATAAQAALVRARREAARAISHRAVLPRFQWLAGRRRPGVPRGEHERSD
jgi:tetratricopeptide (TPR) repeat protein